MWYVTLPFRKAQDAEGKFGNWWNGHSVFETSSVRMQISAVDAFIAAQQQQHGLERRQSLRVVKGIETEHLQTICHGKVLSMFLFSILSIICLVGVFYFCRPSV